MSGKVFVTSDLHLSHQKIALLRGFKTIDEHDEAITQNILDTVGSKDTLWILGDLLFQRGTRLYVLGNLINQLRRKSIVAKVVLGNHDNFVTGDLYGLGIERVFGAAYGKHGILFTHIPVHPGQKDRFTLNVHGHLHSSVIGDPFYFNVCLEQNGLKPFNMEEVYTKIPPAAVKEKEDEALNKCHADIMAYSLPRDAVLRHAGSSESSGATGGRVPTPARITYWDMRGRVELDTSDT